MLKIIVKTLAEMPAAQRSASAVIGNIDLLRRADKLLNAGLTYVDSLNAAKNGAVPAACLQPRRTTIAGRRVRRPARASAEG